MFEDLRGYLSALEEKGYLKRIGAEVDPILEAAEIMRRVMYAKGPALLFENLKGYPGWKMVGNIFGRSEFIKLAFGAEKLEALGERFLSILPLKPPTSLGEKVSTFKEVIAARKYLPKIVRKGAVKEVIDEGFSFEKLPALRTWPKDGGRYLTYPLVITKDPESGLYNIGVYRVQLIGKRRAIIHWQIHKRGAESYDLGGKGMEVAIAIGGDPGTLFAGAAPVPKTVDKYLFAGIMNGRGVELTKGERVDLLIPARAEVVLEGRMTGDMEVEGPFGDHFGYYTPPAKYPVFELETAEMREGPIYHATVVGKPPLEDACIGKAIERVFLPLLKFFVPELVDINMPEYGLFQGMAIVSIKKRYPGQAKKVMMALWGMGQMALTKVLVVVDEDVNVHDINQVIYAIATTVDPQRDVLIVPKTHADVLDHSTRTPGYGSKLGIDATRKLKEEYGDEWPEEVEVDPETRKLVDERWREYGLM